MRTKITCLGIESSCDETAAAIVDSEKNIIAHTIYSQIPEHQKWGGVVPELAARAHILAIDGVVEKTLNDAKMTLNDLDVIAATAGPGLIGGVIVGWEFATGLAQALDKPLVAVNHLEGHALVPRLCDELEFPYMLLLASGGHTQILVAKGVGDYDLIGETLDDSAGEAFDKVAKMLGLGYPGGPIVEKTAIGGDPKAFDFPRPLCDKKNSDFSFSGIKTAARTFLERHGKSSPPSEGCPEGAGWSVPDFCASFQQSIIDVMINRLTNAINESRIPNPESRIPNPESRIPTLVVAGGVAANKAIRTALEKLAEDLNMKFAAPPLKLCTDNGAMIAWAGIENFIKGNITKEPFAPRPRWPLQGGGA
ncbi:MAG: tRNA (adenosine(37)-N6)-threonylcarbamoyltransferase complex transferase subunit TsaD [Rickettsiales bacterium]|jgi:N6-L-threonylcarbamoyladenine synthase|nr:tRNA (adenosine(37)-N6)-threonylcarbamoyltransferase complex transferase subunit TsaD [Rickettsiales bacterium]